MSQPLAEGASFGPTGALLLPGVKKHERAQLLFDPLHMEREWPAGKEEIIGKTSVLVTGVVREIILAKENPDLAQGIQSGIAAMRHLHKIGYDGDTDSSPRLRFPIEEVTTQLQSTKRPLAVAECPTYDAEQHSQPSSWTILSDRYYDNLEELSRRIVLQGAKAALKNIPIGEFGDLVKVDRQEIESLRSIHSLISEYCNQQEDRPVSIAVFSPPGSGKSFAVKQIAKAANSDKKIAEKTHTFNLSQFKSPADLIDAFHQIRDVALSGKIPLAFWDEFDSPLDTELSANKQEKNRAIVRDIPNKLAAFGYAIVPMRNNEQPAEFLIPELKEMAILEHERWMEICLPDQQREKASRTAR